MGSNDAFAFTGNANQNVSTTTNGLNEIASKGGTSFGYDSKGNLTSDGATTYSYDSQNQLKTASGTAPPTYTYDPQGRLWEVAAGTGATRYAYEDATALTQQDPNGTYWRRYVHGPATIEPVVQYQDQNAVTRRFLAIDERGSVIAQSDDSGNVTAINRYDEYGIAQAGNASGFGYAGMLPGSTGVNNDKARFYRTGEGVFMQTDPIRFAGGMNLYEYTGNDPVNAVDPSGLCIGGGGYGYGNMSSVEMGVVCPRLNLNGGALGSSGRSGGVTLLSPVIRRYAPERGGGFGGSGWSPGQWGPFPKLSPPPPLPQCPTGNLESVRRNARAISKWTGRASGVAAIAGAIPSPLTPELEGSAVVLLGASRIATVTVLTADAIYWAKSGSSRAFFGDLIEATVSETLGASGSAASSVNRAAHGTGNGSVADAVFNAGGAEIANLLPNACE